MWDVKYRPLKFSDVLGQEGAVQVLKARLRNGTALDTSYIFSGGHGQGKTTLARILARAVLCQDLTADAEPCNGCDNCQGILSETSNAFFEQDAASNGTIDNIRAIVDDLPFAVFGAAKRVYLFDEAHRMSTGAQDVLLKPIEDKKMVGLFCTTEPEKIRGPIRSRCEEYVIRKITREDVLVRMKYVLDCEKVEHEDDAVLTVIDFSGGHVRDVLNRLEMIGQMGPITIAQVRDYLNLSVVSLYYEVLANLSNPVQAIGLVEQAMERVQPDDVAAGLAEAAMNSYRLAHNMFADFVLVDRDSAKKVHAIYGDNVLRLAEYFLRARHSSRVGLICDILSLANVSGNVPTQDVAPQRLTLAANPAPALQAPAAPVQAPAAVQAAPAAQPAAAPPAAPKPNGVHPQAAGKYTHPDGIGPLGEDIAALTELDHKAVAMEMPRGSQSDQKPNLSWTDANHDEGREILTPDAWKREFERTWLNRGVGPGGI